MQRLFYLENDENDFLLLDFALRKVGAAKSARWFRTISDFKNAIAELSAEDLPRVILLDLNLNGESGMDMLRWLKEEPAYANIPAFIFSSGRIMNEVAAALKENAAGYLFKPSKLEDWIDLARQLKDMAAQPLPTTDTVRLPEMSQDLG